MPSLTGEYSKVTIKHDLMLTPVPYRMWNRTARMILRIKHQPGAIQKISSFFQKNGISILLAESTRSGYRYETWSLHIVFEKLGHRLEFTKENSIYKETFEQVQKLKELLLSNRQIKNLLFTDKNDIDLKNPISILPNTALAYFHNVIETKRKSSNPMYEPFELTYINHGILDSKKDLVPLINSLKFPG